MHSTNTASPMIGLETIAAEVVKNFAGLVLKTAWDMANKPIDPAIKQSIFNASRQYVQNFTERHGILKVLGMREPVPLESIYITVQLLDDWIPHRLESLSDMDAKYRIGRQRRFGTGEHKKRLGSDVANWNQYLMVLGEPGVGKSTFLRKMGLEALKGRGRGDFLHNCIPVFIELKLFKSGEINIESAIAREFKICGFPDYQYVALSHLKQGRLLVLLDGLDEVPTDRMSDVVATIQDFVDSYPKNRFIVSCRGAAYHFNFRRFTDVAIADFEDQQIQKFITNWFHAHPEKGVECWQKLTSAEYAAAKELTHTPLLLTLICLLYQRAGQFPTNRATLYERALRVLLEEWAAEKGLPQEQIYKGLDTKRKELMLSKIAYDAFREERPFLPKREIAKQIERLLKEMLPEETSIDGVKVLKTVEVQHGVLVERAEGIYSFSHLTLQEFLTAQYIVDDHIQVKRLVDNHLTHDHWNEVFLLLSGLKRADNLLLQMEQRSQTYIASPKVQALLNWTFQLTANSFGAYKSAAKRVATLALALACTRIFELAIVLEQISELIRTLTLANTFNHTARTVAIVHEFERVLKQALIRDRTYIRICNHALELAHKLELPRNLDLKLQLDQALELNQALELSCKLKLNRISECKRQLEQAYMHVINHFLDSNIALGFAEAKIFNTNLQVLPSKFEAFRSNVPDRNQPSNIRQAFIKYIQQTWFSALKLRPESLGLSETDLSALESYLKANKLILECKQAAVWVSTKLWEDMEQRILLINSPNIANNAS